MSAMLTGCRQFHIYSIYLTRQLSTWLLASAAFAISLGAFQVTQSAPPPTTSRVQELYAAAKNAEAHGDLDGAIADYQTLLRTAPRLAAAYNNLGALYLQRQQYRKAAEVLKKGLQIDPKMSSARALVGISLYQMGEYASARPELEGALRIHPQDNHAELFLANTLIKLGDFEAAAHHLRQLSVRSPKDQEVWYLLGTVYIKLSEHALGKLNEIDPSSTLMHEISGEIMESMKNYDGALLEYKKAVEMAPQQPGTHYKLGNAYWALSMWDAATKEFEAELKNDPQNCTAQWKIGNISLEQRLDPKESLSDIEKALAVCPNLMPARVDRGRALIKLDRPREAVEELLAAEQTDPSDARIHFLLAQAFRPLGRTKEAQVEMEMFSKLEESARAATAERARQLLLNKESAPQ